MKTIAKPLFGVLVLLPVALLSAAACGGKSTGSNGVMQGSAGNSAGAETGVAGSGEAGSSDVTSPAVCDAGTFDADLYGCTSNTDCQIVPRGCICGSGPLSSYIAFNSIGIHRLSCGTVPCASCGPTTAPDPNDPVLYYIATCQAGSCAVVDLRATEVTACGSDSDCGLRSGTACCSGCGGQTVAINVNRQADLEKLVCDPEPSACPACSPALTGTATCVDGRCSVEPCGTPQNPCPG